jgi:hypothetical protein
MADSWNAAGIFSEVSAVYRWLHRYRNWNGNFADSRDLFALELISTERGIASDDDEAIGWQLARAAFGMMNNASCALCGAYPEGTERLTMTI